MVAPERDVKASLHPTRRLFHRNQLESLRIKKFAFTFLRKILGFWYVAFSILFKLATLPSYIERS